MHTPGAHTGPTTADTLRDQLIQLEDAGMAHCPHADELRERLREVDIPRGSGISAHKPMNTALSPFSPNAPVMGGQVSDCHPRGAGKATVDARETEGSPSRVFSAVFDKRGKNKGLWRGRTPQRSLEKACVGLGDPRLERSGPRFTAAEYRPEPGGGAAERPAKHRN